MILNNTTQTLEIVLGSAVTTNQSPVTVDYVAFTSSATTPSVQLSTTNDATSVTILSAPSASTQYKINGITVANKDTLPITVTIEINDNTVKYPVAQSMVLAVGSTLQFTDTRGWFVINASGQILSAQGSAYSDVQIFTSSNTWNKPLGCSLVYVETTGGGGGGGAGSGVGATRIGGGGGGGGNRLTSIFQISNLTPTVAVTVGAIATGGTGNTGAAGNNGSVGSTSSFGTFLYGYGGGGGGGGGSSTGGGGGGGAGGTSAGATGSNSSVTGGLGGSAFVTSALATLYATNIGGAGRNGNGTNLVGNSSYLGGGGGAGAR